MRNSTKKNWRNIFRLKQEDNWQAARIVNYLEAKLSQNYGGHASLKVALDHSEITDTAQWHYFTVPVTPENEGTIRAHITQALHEMNRLISGNAYEAYVSSKDKNPALTQNGFLSLSSVRHPGHICIELDSTLEAFLTKAWPHDMLLQLPEQCHIHHSY